MRKQGVFQTKTVPALSFLLPSSPPASQSTGQGSWLSPAPRGAFCLARVSDHLLTNLPWAGEPCTQGVSQSPHTLGKEGPEGSVWAALWQATTADHSVPPLSPRAPTPSVWTVSPRCFLSASLLISSFCCLWTLLLSFSPDISVLYDFTHASSHLFIFLNDLSKSCDFSCYLFAFKW